MLAQHAFYLYHQGDLVMARRGSEAPVVALRCATPQAAHDYVQSVVNPEGLHPAKVGPLGYNEPAWQAQISAKCEAAVRAAYEAAGK